MKNITNLKYPEIGLHFLFWIIYFTYPIIKFGDDSEFTFDFYLSLINTLFIGLTVYTTLICLIKNIKNKAVIVILLLILILIIYLNCYYYIQYCKCSLRLCLIRKTVEYLLVNAFFVAIFTIRKNIKSKHIIESIEKERVNAELKSLKAQMNPHFLFNTLNITTIRKFFKNGQI